MEYGFNLKWEFEEAKRSLRLHLRLALGAAGLLVCAFDDLTWRKKGDPVPPGVQPGWEEARIKEFEALEKRDGLRPEDFRDQAIFRQAWHAADKAAQDAFCDRLDLEEDPNS